MQNRSKSWFVWGWLLCVLGTTESHGDFAPNMSFQAANDFFKEHRSTFEEIVRDLRACPGSRTIEPARLTASNEKCPNGTRQIPVKVASKLRSLKVLWAIASWGKYRDPTWDPSVFVGVNFILQSQGIATHGAGVSIAYFEEALTPTAVANGWIPLVESPIHWSYHSTN